MAKSCSEKIINRQELAALRLALRAKGARVVLTNGCFDLLHPGHIRYLEKARALGDALIVALNSDESVRKLKGPGRPILPLDARCQVLAALESVDYVTVFQEETPAKIVREVLPDVLAKGGDWSLDRIIGRETVEESGGQVVSIDFEEGFSTTALIDRIRRGANDD